MIVVIFNKPGDDFKLNPRNLTQFSKNLHEILPSSSLVSQNIQCRQIFFTQGVIEPIQYSTVQFQLYITLQDT